MTDEKMGRKVELDLTRRDFLTVAAAAGGSAVAAYAVTTGPLSPFGELKRRQIIGEAAEPAAHVGQHWGMLIDLDVCIGCEYCQRACSAINDVASDRPWNIVQEDQTRTGKTFYFSRPCLHCQHAPCVDVCPTGASYTDDKDGLVKINKEICIGCELCIPACPYGALKSVSQHIERSRNGLGGKES